MWKVNRLVLITIFSFILTGCTFLLNQPYTTKDIDISHIQKCHAKLVSTSSTPRWEFWNPQAQAWITNEDSTCKFIPLSGSDWLTNSVGQIGAAVVNHTTISIPAVP